MAAGLELPDGHDPDCSPVGEILLAPIEEAARSATLLWRDHHRPGLPQMTDSINYIEFRLTDGQLSFIIIYVVFNY